MKKAILLISLFSYLLVTSGVVVNFHYCMDKLASTQLFAQEQTRCGKCGMHKDNSNGCCRDESVVIKMTEDQTNFTSTSAELVAYELQPVVPSVFIETPFENFGVTRHYQNHSPPLLAGQDTYLRNGVFRI